MLIYFISQPNVSYFNNNTSMNADPQKNNKGVHLFMNNVHIIMYITSISYLNGLFIKIIFFQKMFMYYA